MPDVSIASFGIMFVVVFMLVGIPLIILRLLVRAANRPSDNSSRILGRRFAKGEITLSEFEAAKRILGS